MKSIVRDDIISLDNYVAAEFKYKEYLELLFNAGGYCFLDQFKTFIQGGATIIKNMQEHNLVGVENINNCYKYVYLTDTATKYIELRDSEEDFSKVKKNQISVKKFKKNPSQKQLLISAFKFHLLTHGDGSITKEKINNIFYEYLIRINFEKYIQDASKEIVENRIESYKDNIKKYEGEIKAKELEIKGYEKHFKCVFGNLNKSLIDNEIRSLAKESNDISNEIETIAKAFVKIGLTDAEHRKQLVDTKIELLTKQQEELREIINNNSSFIDEQKKELDKLIEPKVKLVNSDRLVSKILQTKVNPAYKNIKKKVDNLHDISKIIARLDGDKLEFNIFDCGSFSTGDTYIKHINSLTLNEIPYTNIKVVIYSYAENRAKNLFAELQKEKDKRKKAEAYIKKHEDYIASGGIGKCSTTIDKYYISKKTVQQIPKFNIIIKSDMYYIGKYIKNVSKADKVIKLKDKKAIGSLAAILNSKR